MAGRDCRVSRRRFLQMAMAAAAAHAGIGQIMPSRPVTSPAAAAGFGTRTATWNIAAPEFVAESEGVLVSPVWSAPFLFNGLGARWQAPDDATSSLQVEFRTHDGSGWTQWTPAAALHGPTAPAIAATDLVVAAGGGAQVRVRTLPGFSDAPAPDSFTVTALDSSSGPTDDQAAEQAGAASPSQYGLAAIVSPNQIGRQAWGANENYRYRHGVEYWTRGYSPVKKLIIHHTAQTNDQPDPAVILRNLYYYHAIVQDWGDVGYNFVIDRNGRVYEGRAGGLNAQGWPVEAGHADRYNPGSIGIALLGTFSSPATPPPDAMVQALTNLVSYKVVQHGIHPMGSGFFIDKNLPNIMGHRDCLPTECPGASVYPLLPSIREQALANLPPLGQSWVKQQLPAAMIPRSISTGSVTVRNSGSQIWNRTGSSPFRIGYRWFRSNGEEIHEANLEIHSELPKDVPPGQEVSIPIRVKAPSILGSFTLKLDMIQQGVTWFGAMAGNEPLAMNVSVSHNLGFRTTLPWVGRSP